MARLLPTWSVSLFVLLRRSGRPEDFLRALRAQEVESSFKCWNA